MKLYMVYIPFESFTPPKLQSVKKGQVIDSFKDTTPWVELLFKNKEKAEDVCKYINYRIKERTTQLAQVISFSTNEKTWKPVVDELINLVLLSAALGEGDEEDNEIVE